jgi:hypothetical protein
VRSWKRHGRFIRIDLSDTMPGMGLEISSIKQLKQFYERKFITNLDYIDGLALLKRKRRNKK